MFHLKNNNKALASVKHRKASVTCENKYAKFVTLPIIILFSKNKINSHQENFTLCINTKPSITNFLN